MMMIMTPDNHPRRGIALLVVVVLLVVVSLFLGVLLKQTLQDLDQQQHIDDQIQTAYLLDSGRELAWSRLRADPTYQGETWIIPTARLANKGEGKITIRVNPVENQNDNDNAPRTFTVIAEFPRHEVHQVRQTGQFRFPATTTTTTTIHSPSQPTGEPRS